SCGCRWAPDCHRRLARRGLCEIGRSRFRRETLSGRRGAGLPRRRGRRLRRHQDRCEDVMKAVELLREKTARWLGIDICAHFPLVAGLEWVRQGSPGVLTAIAAVLALATGGMTFATRGPTLRYFQGAAMMLTVATLVAAMDGHPWQIDMHMYFFASLA